jgi:hypothetical protein
MHVIVVVGGGIFAFAHIGEGAVRATDPGSYGRGSLVIERQDHYKVSFFTRGYSSVALGQFDSPLADSSTADGDFLVLVVFFVGLLINMFMVVVGMVRT